MEGADCNLVGVLYARTQPRTHFFGGADGERDGAYLAWIHAPFYQPCDAFGQRKRFARARSGYHGGDARVAVRSRGLNRVYAFCGRGALFAGIRRRAGLTFNAAARRSGSGEIERAQKGNLTACVTKLVGSE